MKHANPTIWPTAEKTEPAHSHAWDNLSRINDLAFADHLRRTSGKHAKPFGKHHPATPILSTQPATEKIHTALSHEALIET